MAEELLRQSVRWGEHYVSRALNAKFAGIIRPGVYHGYELAPGGYMKILVKNDQKYARSVAVVERDGYSLTVLMDDSQTVDIPAPGVWFICVEAFYAPTQTGYQRLVAREKVESHHVPLGKVTVTSAANITQAMISYEGRQLGTITADPESLIQDEGGLGINADGLIYLKEPLRKVWNISANIAANGSLAFPSNATYKVGQNVLHIFWLGLRLAKGKDYQEVGAAGASSSSVKLLFAAEAGDEFQIEIYK